jgi:hypothetical protein
MTHDFVFGAATDIRVACDVFTRHTHAALPSSAPSIDNLNIDIWNRYGLFSTERPADVPSSVPFASVVGLTKR